MDNGDYNIPVYGIRVQHTKVCHDTERFGFYKTEDEAKSVCEKLVGRYYKVNVEKSYSKVPFEELIAKVFTRYPNI